MLAAARKSHASGRRALQLRSDSAAGVQDVRGLPASVADRRARIMAAGRCERCPAPARAGRVTCARYGGRVAARAAARREQPGPSGGVIRVPTPFV